MIEWKNIKDIQPEDGIIQIIVAIKHIKLKHIIINRGLFINNEVNIRIFTFEYQKTPNCDSNNYSFTTVGNFICGEYEITHWDYLKYPECN